MKFNEINLCYLKKSNIKSDIKKIFNKHDNILINYIDQSNIESTEISKSGVFIFEEDSYINSIEVFDKIFKSFKKKPAIIILSSNNDVYNVVRWMRKGACDYLIKGTFNKTILTNSINNSLEYLNQDKKSNQIKNQLKYKPVQMPANVNWQKLIDNKNYDLALIMIDIVIDEKHKSRYNKASIELICNQIKNEVNNIAGFFGGKMWYWTNTLGVFVFHFGNMADCAALTAISVYNNFFQICIEKLKLKEVFHFKMGINYGQGIFHKTNTESITSDLINRLSHLTKKYSKQNTFDITESTYKELNPRLKNYFNYIGKFENKKIYQYNFFNY